MTDTSITDSIHYTADEFNDLYRPGLYKKDEKYLSFIESEGYTIYGYEVTGKRTKLRTEFNLWFKGATPSFRAIKVRMP